MRLRYRAIDSNGASVVDTIESAGLAEAGDDLRRRGLFPLEIAADTGEKTAAGLSRGKSLRYLVGFTRELSVLLTSGCPLADALGALERQAQDATWRGVLHGLRVGVEEGKSLSVAMASYPRYFDAVCRGLIAAGEQSGGFQPILERLAGLVRRQLHVRSAVIGAMIYPALLMVVAVAVMILMLTFVLPRFAGLFDTLDSPIPPSTKALMNVSAFLQNYGVLLLMGIVGAGVGVHFWMRSPAGRARVDAFMVKAPMVGKAVRALCVARVARVLGMLLCGKVPLVEALQLTRETSGNQLYRDMLSEAELAVTRGGALSSAFLQSGLMPPSLCEAVRNGEQSGRLGELMLGVADFLDEENETVIRSLSKTLEPLILIGLGAFVGFVVISMFMPLFDLTAMVETSP